MSAFSAGETLLVIGLGRSGQASARVLRERGARVYATDEKPLQEIAPAIDLLERSGAVFVPPAEVATLIATLTGAVLSPGVPPNNPLVRRVRSAGIPMYSEIEVAYRLCDAPIVAITGTKGKSTTTALTAHLLRACGKTVHVGGNIGDPLIEQVRAARSADWVVAEVSSFQLESIHAFRPRIAVMLNLGADHLDRYSSMAQYAQAKYRIFANQDEHDFFVGNLDDERLAALAWQTGETRVRARQLWFTLSAQHERATMYLRDDAILYAPIQGDPRPIEIARIDEIPLAGAHNTANAMAAMLAVLAAGAEPALLRGAVGSFTAMPHRLQHVGEIGGVLYVDDSKATNPSSAIAALAAYERPLVVIAGGRSKNTDFAPLGRAIDERAKALVTIGEAAAEIAAQVHRAPVQHAESLDDAVRRAQSLALPGDAVLFSPACASFDMFESAEDRGRRFIAAVHALREPAGR